MLALAVCVLTSLFGIAEELRDNPGDVLVCYPGDTVKELSVSIFSDSFWVETIVFNSIQVKILCISMFFNGLATEPVLLFSTRMAKTTV